MSELIEYEASLRTYLAMCLLLLSLGIVGGIEILDGNSFNNPTKDVTNFPLMSYSDFYLPKVFRYS